ncbi:MAG: aminotransferase class I/II-fold pyridoxal phosphate-dependent enzyme [Simkaniaceae bacterium]|nr:aminotransferase class I/II-fold pyridoxal phosphate-dependent enzyme [Simkaniaceae bacterium]
MNTKEAYYKHLLDKKLKQSRYKQLKCILPLDDTHANQNEKPLLNFNSSDFLGLAQHPFVKKNTIKYVLKWGAGSSASRLITSHLETQYQLEKRLACILNRESTFFLNPLQNIHELILSPIAVKEAVLFIDEGIFSQIKKAAHRTSAKILFFHHNDHLHLKQLLEEYPDPDLPKVILSESIFQAFGDLAPIKELVDLSKKHQALLYIDDSLSFAAMGHSGFGLAATKKGIDIVVSSFGRSCGSFGSFVVSSEMMKEFLLSFSPELAADTLLPPAALGAIEASLDLIPDMHEERMRIAYLSKEMREALHDEGIAIGSTTTHIIPVHLRNDNELFSLSHYFVEEQILAQNLKSNGLTTHPTIRLTINALHTKEQIKAFSERLKHWKRPLSYEKAFQ